MAQTNVYPRSRTVPKQRDKDAEKILPPITPNNKKLTSYDVPSGGSRDQSFRGNNGNSPGSGQHYRMNSSNPQSRARSSHKKQRNIGSFFWSLEDPKLQSKEFGVQTEELPGIYQQAVTVKTQSRESERPSSRMNGEAEIKQNRINIVSNNDPASNNNLLCWLLERKYFSDPENDIREDATEDITQEIDTSHISNKFYTKTDYDDNPSTIYNQKNSKSISSNDGQTEKRSIETQERNLKKKKTIEQADNIKVSNGSYFNYQGDASGSEHSVPNSF
jgi:hypothetical protein